jgi:hypothetical protein
MISALPARKASDADAHPKSMASGDLLITLSRVGSFRAGRHGAFTMRKLLTLLIALSANVFGAGSPSQAWWQSIQQVAVSSGGGGSVAFDAVSSNVCSTCVTTDLTWTHTPVGTPTAVAVLIENYEPNGSITAVHYGVSAMTLAVSESDGGFPNTAQIWCLANPPSGTQTVDVTGSAGGMFIGAAAITVTNSNTSSCFSHTAVAITVALGEELVAKQKTRAVMAAQKITRIRVSQNEAPSHAPVSG